MTSADGTPQRRRPEELRSTDPALANPERTYRRQAPDEDAEARRVVPVGDDVRVPTEELLVQWAPQPLAPETQKTARPPVRFAGPALLTGVAALAGSLITGWVAPLAVVAIVLAIVAFARASSRTLERRVYAGWGLALGVLALVYCAGWFWWMWSAGGFGPVE